MFLNQTILLYAAYREAAIFVVDFKQLMSESTLLSIIKILIHYARFLAVMPQFIYYKCGYKFYTASLSSNSLRTICLFPTILTRCFTTQTHPENWGQICQLSIKQAKHSPTNISHIPLSILCLLWTGFLFNSVDNRSNRKHHSQYIAVYATWMITSPQKTLTQFSDASNLSSDRCFPHTCALITHL